MRRISWRKRKKKKKPLEKIWGKLSDPKNGIPSSSLKNEHACPRLGV
jgi:hypothetical protein